MENYKIKYVSASGSVLDMSNDKIDANGTNMPSWEFYAVSLNGRVAGLKQKMPVYTIPVVVSANDVESGIAAKNALYEIPAADVDNNTPGRLYFNDWYIEGYMTASDATNFWQTKAAAQYELTFTASTPKWVRETTNSYSQTVNPIGIYLDYPHDFPYDFGVSEQIFTIDNHNYSDTDVLLRIFGNATNPHITIGSNEYRLEMSIAVNEYVEIDGFNHSVTLVRANGKRENAFQHVVGDFRKDSGSYIFQPIKPGVSEVTWPGDFNFDIVEYEQRSEPRWS